MSPEVVSVGDLNIDILLYPPKYPELGSEAMSEVIEFKPGGSAANTAVALARLGISSGFIGRVGSDYWGRFLVEDLRREGVDTSYIQFDDVHGTGTMVIIVVGNERTIIGYRGANRYLEWKPELGSYVLSARVLHVSGYTLLEDPQRATVLKLLQFLRSSRGVAVVTLDTGYVISAIGIHELVKLTRGFVDYVLTNKGELSRALSELGLGTEVSDVVELLKMWCVRALVAKAGPEGAYLYTVNGKYLHSPAIDVEVVDTTGAGDAFNAGFIYGVIRGFSLEEACQLGNAVAAYKICGRGARYLPTMEQLLTKIPLPEDLRMRLSRYLAK